MRHIVFLMAYIYFLIVDIKRKEINLIALIIYAILSLATLVFTREDINSTKLIDAIYSILFGLTIFLLSYFSMEGLGLADGIYFVINGLLLPLKENILLFLTGLFVAFIIGIFLYYFGNNKTKSGPRLPFIPCCLPAIVGYIICIV